MAISTATKVGAAGTVTAGGGLTGAYLVKDRIFFYEVERKVMDEEVEFDTETKGTENSKDSFTIKVKPKDSDIVWGAEEEKYSWECKVIGKQGVIDHEDLKILFDKATGSTYDIKRRLVQACSKNRGTNPNSKKISATVDISDDKVTKDTWIKDLLGTEVLNETEKAILIEDNKVHFSLDPEGASKFPLTVTAKVGDANKSKWTNKGYSWKCILSGSESSPTALKDKIPSGEDGISDKKLDRKKLVYACAKDRTIKGKEVEAKFNFPKETTNSKQYLFGA